jgi:hypothetical protein
MRLHGRLTLSLLGASATLVFVIAPCRITQNAHSPELSLQAAWAKDGSNSKGGGSDKGGTGKDGSKSESGGKSDPGGDTGKAGSKGESRGGSGGRPGPSRGNDSGAAQSSAPDDPAAERKSDGRLQRVNPVTGDLIQLNGSNIKVLHPEGMKEEIENGRYVMKDAMGRTIISRPATDTDGARLRGLMH